MTTTDDIARRFAAQSRGLAGNALGNAMRRVADNFRGDIMRNGSEAYLWSSGGSDGLSAAGNKTTGNYLRAWDVEVQATPTVAQAIVSNPTVYGPRLEFGFVGADSLGRVYAQQPRPHVEPAVEPNMILMRRTIDALLEGRRSV